MIIRTINRLVPNGILIGIILDVNMVSWENPQKSWVFHGKNHWADWGMRSCQASLKNTKRGLIESTDTAEEVPEMGLCHLHVGLQYNMLHVFETCIGCICHNNSFIRMTKTTFYRGLVGFDFYCTYFYWRLLYMYTHIGIGIFNSLRNSLPSVYTK